MSQSLGASALESKAIVISRLCDIASILDAAVVASPDNGLVRRLVSMVSATVTEVINDLDTEVV